MGKTAAVIQEKYFLKDNDLLLARSGNTVGKSYLHKVVGYDCFFAGYMIRFKINASKVIPQYIFVYTQTDFYRKWIKAVQRTTGQPNINAEEYRSLEIPLPDKIVQEKIVNIYFGFLSQKKQNETEAEKLLASIDDYLLKKLGITLPTPPENTLNNRMFTTKVSELSGNRFDPHFNKIYFKDVFKSLSKSKFNITRIKDVLENIKTGTTPHQRFEPFVESAGVVFLRNTNLKKYQIDLSDTKFVNNEFAKELIYSVKGEIIMCIAGTVGLSAVNHIEYPISINQNVSALKLLDKINVDFAAYWFNTNIFLELTKRACSVATILYLNNDNLKLLPIPVPPLAKQKEIANHITTIRQQAQQLKDKTKEAFKKASEEIEKILLT
ncbi:MAG: restriction endonuclease subunit S [Chitinophagaceae bacterium]|nr:restriction endonuclease subunit S [Chitinophagaceae bacterium]